MKIAIDCRMLGSGGIGSYLAALLPYFTQNYECLLLGDSKTLVQYKNKNTSIEDCNIKTFSITELFRFPKAILKKINECALFYSPYCNVPGGIKIPIYTTIHDVVFLDVPGLASKTGTYIRKLCYLYAIKKSSLIFTVSEFSKERIIHHLKCKKDVVVTYNAVPSWFLTEKDIADENKQNYILFVGNIKKHKGLSVLIDAFLEARSKGFASYLKIVGNAANFRTNDQSVLNKIQSAPAGSIVFTGKISDSDLKFLYKNALRLVQPSFYEGFGMPPLEAMSLGTKVILSDIPVFKEIYKDFPVKFFRTGNSSDLCNKLLSIKDDKEPVKNLPEIYSFERTFSIIRRTLEEHS
ncbi:MAG: glycosyltransferase family 4 protein [Treponema sp.]|nr:glycosyltransferase family 4 protein [Treponema sp.]